MKQLIVNADDFGIHHEVNQAVYMAFHKGILTSTSLMAGGRAFSEAAGMALAMPSMGTGVHLTLVGGLPSVLPPEEVPSLTWEDGCLCRSYGELLERDMKGRIRADDVYREWDAQIRKIMAAGISITHMDGHSASSYVAAVFPHCSYTGHEISYSLHADSCRKFFLWGPVCHLRSERRPGMR